MYMYMYIIHVGVQVYILYIPGVVVVGFKTAGRKIMHMKNYITCIYMYTTCTCTTCTQHVRVLKLHVFKQ